MTFERFVIKGSFGNFGSRLAFEYAAYVGCSFSWEIKYYSGWSGTPPYCFNHLKKSEAAEMLSLLPGIASGDITRNQKDILSSIERECQKLLS